MTELQLPEWPLQYSERERAAFDAAPLALVDSNGWWLEWVLVHVVASSLIPSLTPQRWKDEVQALIRHATRGGDDLPAQVYYWGLREWTAALIGVYVVLVRDSVTDLRIEADLLRSWRANPAAKAIMRVAQAVSLESPRAAP